MHPTQLIFPRLQPLRAIGLRGTNANNEKQPQDKSRALHQKSQLTQLGPFLAPDWLIPVFTIETKKWKKKTHGIKCYFQEVKCEFGDAKCTNRDSNPGRKNGNLTCYPYTIGADVWREIAGNLYWDGEWEL